MRAVVLLWMLCVCSSALFAQTQTPPPRNYPAFVEGDYVIQNFHFRSGETLPDLRLHYVTLGDPTKPAVLMLHGTNQSGAAMLTPNFAGKLFGPGQPLDATNRRRVEPFL